MPSRRTTESADSAKVSTNGFEKKKEGFSIFTPAVKLMNNMKYPIKFTLISLILDIPSLLLLGLLTSVRNEAIDFGQKERLGLEYNEPVKELLFHVAEHRQAALIYFEGGESDKTVAKKLLQELQSKVENDITAIDDVDNRLGETLEGKEKWAEVRKLWKATKESVWKSSPEKSYADHSEVIDKIVLLLAHIGDISNLVLDPDIDSYYMMDGVIFRIPLLVQKISEARDLGQRVALGKELSSDRLAELIFVLPGIVENTFDGIKLGASKSYEFKNIYNGPKVKDIVNQDFDASVGAINAFLAQTKPIRKVALDSTFDAKQYVEAGNMALAAMRKLYAAEAKALDELLVARVESFTFQKRLMQVGIPLIWALVVYLLIGFYRSVMKTVNSLDEISKKLVKGDTDERVELEAKDELASVGESFNTIGQALVQRNRELEENKKKLEESLHLLEESYGKLEESNARIQEQQTQLIQSEKMASLGQMVAGIAHEVNTPLGFVRNNIEVLDKNQRRLLEVLERYRDLRDSLVNGQLDELEVKLVGIIEASKKIDSGSFSEKVQALIGESIDGIDRIQQLVLDLKNFSRLDEASFKESDLNQGIESTLKIAHNIVKYKAEVIKDYAPELKAECFPARINQVLLNIITNAAQAIEGQGNIWIKTYKEDGMAVIKIRDNGKGIPQENLKKIFEPFFTTKDVGQGTGLGLSIVYKIIEQHKGTITVQSEVGKGTEFTIKLPVKQSKQIGKPASTLVLN
jgi:signal transduction histidine kinase